MGRSLFLGGLCFFFQFLSLEFADARALTKPLQGTPQRTPQSTQAGTLPGSSAKNSQKGIVTGEDVQIYKDSDFDSQVIGQVKQGQTFEISQTVKGPFYKIRLKPGVIGWISDADIQPIAAGAAASKRPKVGARGKEAALDIEAQKNMAQKNIAQKKLTQENMAKQRPFAAQRFRGPAIEALNWSEDTMGATRSETLNFYGANWSGNNTMFSGEMFTDANLLVALAPPKYYQELTGNSASGWIFKMNFLFQTVLPQARHYYLYYGFGPSFTYSHFNVALTEGARTLSYALEDMSIGALFDLGIAFRVGGTAPRIAVKYTWEKKQMISLAFSWGWEF